MQAHGRLSIQIDIDHAQAHSTQGIYIDWLTAS